MVYDPHRDDLPPVEPGRVYRDQARYRAGVTMSLGAALLAVISGLVYVFAGSGDRTVANHEVITTEPPASGAEPAPETTGSSTTLPQSRER
jgi:hypothetical protein